MIRLSLQARPSEVFAMAEMVTGVLPPALRTDAVQLGILEALSNAIVHGALEIGSRDTMPLDEYLKQLEEGELRHGAARVVDVLVEARGPRGASITIDDPGNGFDVAATQVQPRRGLDIIHRTFSSVRLERDGRRLVLSLGGVS